jgi:Rieske 2Fe-2S family protein
MAAAKTFERARLASGAMTLEARHYVSPEIFREEQERIFARHWMCIGREEQIARAGDYFLADVGGESLLAVRDKSGTVHAFYNVCRHRGTRVCEAGSGHLAGSIQCPYHAWTYALDGRLIAARNMDDVAGFDRTNYALHEAAVALFEGFIFVNLTPDAQAFAQSFEPLIGRFAQWEISRLETAHAISYELACNWKLVFMNYSECYHCPVLHPQLDKLSPSDSGRNDLAEGPFLGGYSELRPNVDALTSSGRSNRAPINGVQPENRGRVYYYTIFPSILLSLHPDYVMVHYVRPIAPDKTHITCAWLFAPEEMRDPRFDPKDAVEFWDLTNRQDWHVNELTQQGLASRAYTPGPYAHSEALLVAFDRYYREAMR